MIAIITRLVPWPLMHALRRPGLETMHRTDVQGKPADLIDPTRVRPDRKQRLSSDLHPCSRRSSGALSYTPRRQDRQSCMNIEQKGVAHYCSLGIVCIRAKEMLDMLNEAKMKEWMSPETHTHTIACRSRCNPPFTWF